MRIEVLGTGCPKCRETEKRVKRAVKELDVDAEVVKIEDMDEIINRGIMMMPAIIVGDKVIFQGTVPSVKDIKEALQK